MCIKHGRRLTLVNGVLMFQVLTYKILNFSYIAMGQTDVKS